MLFGKKDSKVKFDFKVVGGGWEDYVLTVDGKEIYLITTDIFVTYELNELLEWLCCLSHDYNTYDNTHNDVAYTNLCEGILIDPGQGDFMTEIEAPGETHSPEYYDQFYDEVPESFSILWSGESNSFLWTVKRSLERGNKFMLDVTIKTHYYGSEDEELYQYCMVVESLLCSFIIWQ
ncbi:hypothetical protein [Butyrivibrio sp. AE3006]|uniref:hypothetical protein n=1 Tax=Butyrivibrio sp. AE3006 TaxID=1280673 RepID=UPI00041C8AB8|nr:hypothetical protein [Butyrivibrio sp. AE3006]